ncbi:zinc finger protein 511 isoform X2 [Nematostella vectensis]|uniref:zinc finger protein 511 isoform X2 n=1 Tax=Nematostella vectensis TaxID=45351 RepID=UPI0013905442|nr:zinc finger protein 511 isoform X2 [Nematostella vectensis]
MSEFVVSSSFVWAFRPVKRLILPDDPFFEEGNIYCNILRKQIDLSDDIDDLLESGCSGFKCSIPGCAEVFRSISRFDSHYKTCHWNVCRYCKKSFPSNHLLEIHILENHDTLFQMIARKSNMYRCLVESCPDKFSSENERKDHLVQFHHYPADFRFNRPSRTQRKLLNRKEHSASEPSTMEVDSSSSKTMHERPTEQKPQPKPRMPANICFGRGSARVFQRGSFSKKSGKKSKQRNTYKPGAQVDEVTMKDVS